MAFDAYKEHFAKKRAADEERERKAALSARIEEKFRDAKQVGPKAFAPVVSEHATERDVTEAQLKDVRSYNPLQRGSYIQPVNWIESDRFPGILYELTLADIFAIDMGAYCGHCLEQQHPMNTTGKCRNLKNRSCDPVNDSIVLEEWKSYGPWKHIIPVKVTPKRT